MVEYGNGWIPIGGAGLSDREVDESRYDVKHYCAIAVMWSEDELIRAVAR